MKKVSLILMFILFCTSISFNSYVYGVEESFDNNVENNIDSDKDDEQVKVLTEDIEITAYQEVMNVRESQTITAAVVPVNATDTVLKYSSANDQVATVTSGGVVLAQGKGTTIIRIQAGSVVKELPLTVKVATKAITLNKNYVTLRQGEQFQISAKVMPVDTEQSLTYETNNDSVSVNSTGLVIGQKKGTSSVIVSNGDLKAVVTIIVNEDSYLTKETSESIGEKKDNDFSIGDDSKDEIVIDGSGMDKISRELLTKIYGTDKKIIVNNGSYKIIIYGKDVINPENEMIININLNQSENGISFSLGDKLPGKIYIDLMEYTTKEYKYFYIFDRSQNKYNMLSVKKMHGALEIDVAGDYTVSKSKLNKMHVSKYLFYIGSIASLLIIVVYIVFKKRYWFW